MSVSVAIRVPLNTGDTAAMTHRSTSSAATGVAGSAISAAHPAHTRSQTTSTRRGGNRSATPDSSVPPTR